MRAADVRRLAEGLDGTAADLPATLQAHWMAELAAEVRGRLFQIAELRQCRRCGTWVRDEDRPDHEDRCPSMGGGEA